MAFIQRAIQEYNHLFTELGDPRTKDWFLMSSPVPVFAILALYVYFSVKGGPEYMKDRQPYKLKTVVMVYNVIQIILSSYMTCIGIAYVILEKYNFQCQSVNYSESPLQIKWAGAIWLFFISKIMELLDTVFFILRKKNNQATFLHIYHHGTMPIITWAGAKYAAGGQGIIESAINCFIHVIMYSYYLVSGLGPQYQKYLWWKKYLTSMQLIQFVIVVILNINCLMATDCNYPRFMTISVMVNCIIFFYLFGKFYYSSYVNNKKAKTA